MIKPKREDEILAEIDLEFENDGVITQAASYTKLCKYIQYDRIMKLGIMPIDFHNYFRSEVN